MAEKIAAPITHKTLVSAPQEAVFDALATSAGFDRWFTDGTTLEGKPGGEMVLCWVDWGADRVTTESNCRVVTYERPDRFSYSWWTDPSTTVSLEFSTTDEGTLVTVHEEGYQNSPTGWERCLDCATGWGEALTLVKFYLEHGVTYR